MAGSLPIELALGVQWNVETDTLGFKVKLKDQPATRRGILASISALYDPLGLASPFLLNGKLIMQRLCQETVGLDEPISDNLRREWDD